MIYGSTWGERDHHPVAAGMRLLTAQSASVGSDSPGSRAAAKPPPTALRLDSVEKNCHNRDRLSCESPADA